MRERRREGRERGGEIGECPLGLRLELEWKG